MNFERAARWLDKYTRGEGAKGDPGGVGVAKKIDKAFKGPGQKYSDPNQEAKSKAAAAQASNVKTMAGRYASGKEADKRMQAAADRRSANRAKAAKSYADRTTGGKGSSPYDSPEDQKKYQTAHKKRMDAGDRPSGTRAEVRKWRIENKDHKGKYYGPDKFKGDLKKIAAWKKAGKPRNADGSPKE